MQDTTSFPTPIMPKAAAQRSWWWDHYEDHPSFRLGLGGTEGFAGAPSSGKHKIYCKQCFNAHVAALIQEDKESVTLGTRTVERDQPQIEAHCMSNNLLYICLFIQNTLVWALKLEVDTSGYGWISSATTTALNHLRLCKLVGEDV